MEESDTKNVPEMRDDVYERSPEDTVELEVFGEVEDDIVTPETISDGLDEEVPEDRDEKDPTGRPMVTMEVMFIWVRGFPCVVCGEGLVDKVGLKQHMNWHH